jgi:hypothetical protein
VQNCYALDISALFGEKTYSIYQCIDMSPKKTSSDCARELTAKTTFKADKNKSEVFMVLTLTRNGQKAIKQLEDCKVIDKLNWICGGKETNETKDGYSFYLQDYKYQMIDGEVQTFDMVTRNYVPGYPMELNIFKAHKFIKE